MLAHYLYNYNLTQILRHLCHLPRFCSCWLSSSNTWQNWCHRSRNKTLQSIKSNVRKNKLMNSPILLRIVNNSIPISLDLCIWGHKAICINYNTDCLYSTPQKGQFWDFILLQKVAFCHVLRLFSTNLLFSFALRTPGCLCPLNWDGLLLFWLI